MAIDFKLDLGDILQNSPALKKAADMAAESADKLASSLENLDKKSQKKIKPTIDNSQLTKEATEAQKIIDEYGKGGRSKYLVSEEAMVKNLTKAYEQYNKAISQSQKDKSRGDVMRWSNAYRGAGYDTKKVDDQIFDFADQVYKSYDRIDPTSGKKSNQMRVYSKEYFKTLFDAMKTVAGGSFDFSANETHWAKDRRDTDIGNQVTEKIVSDVKQGVKNASKQKIDVPIDDILNVEIGNGKNNTIQKKIDVLRGKLEDFYKKAYNQDGDINVRRSEKPIDDYISAYSEYAKYMDKIGGEIEERYKEIYNNINKFSPTRAIVKPDKTTGDPGRDDFKQLKEAQENLAKSLVEENFNKARKKAELQLAAGIKPSEKAVKSGEDTGEKIVEGMKEAGEAAKEAKKEIEQTVEATKAVSEAEKSSESTPAEKTAEAHRVAAVAAEEHAEKAKEATKSIQEEIVATQQLNAEQEKSSQQSIQDNTAQQAKENEEALHKQAEAQREVNDAKEQSNDKSKLSSASQEISQVEQMEAALDFQKKKLYDLQKQAEAVKQVYDDLQDRNEYIKARRNVKGTKDKPNPFGLDGNLDKLYEQAIDHINRKEPNMAKAAAYYGFYRNAGGKDRAVVNGEDFTRQLVERWNAIQKLNKAIREGSINASDYGVDSLNAANEAIREQQRIVDNVTEKVSQTKKEAAEQRKAERELAAQEYEDSKIVWSQGLNEQEIAGVEAYLKKVKALEKEAYNETDALAKAMSLVEKIKKRDVSGLMDQFTKDTAENNALLGKITNMPVRSQKQRNAAIRSINQEQYDQLIKGQTEAVVEQGMQGVADASKDAATSGTTAMEDIGQAAAKAGSQVNEVYEAVEKIMHLSWNGGESFMNLDLNSLMADKDNIKRVIDTIKLNYDTKTWDENFKHLNDFIYDRQRQLTRWFSRTDKDSGWDPKNNAFDAEVYKNFSGEKTSDLKKMQTRLGANAKTLFSELYSGGKIPDELKGYKNELFGQLKNGSIDAMNAVDQLLQKVKELYTEQNNTQSLTNANTFASDIKSLEGYSDANEDFLNQLIASVVTGQKEYDAAMEELRAHIAQRQEEIKAEQEKNLRTNTEIGKFASGAKPILDAMGITENEAYPTQYGDFIKQIQSESVKGEEAVRRFADAMGYAYDEANKKWSKIEGGSEPIQTKTQDIVRSQEEIQAEIERTNSVIKVQKQWMDYLGDPNAPVTSTGKRDATDILRNATKRLANYRMHPEEYIGQMDEEKITVHWWKAMQEAQRQGVANSAISRYRTDISESDYEGALSKLQESLALHKDILQKSEDELVQLQAELQQAASEGAARNPSLSSSAADQHREQQQSAEDAATSEEHLKEAEEAAAQAGASSGETTAQHQQQAESAEEAVTAEEKLKNATQDTANVGAETSATANVHKQQEESANAAADAEEKLKSATSESQQAGFQESGVTHAHREQQKAAEDAAEAEDRLSRASEESARLIRETESDFGSYRTKTYELSKGLTRTEGYRFKQQPDDSYQWEKVATQDVANYNVLLQDTIKYTQLLTTAQAALKLAQEKNSGKEVTDAIRQQINYYQQMIDKNRELAESYAKDSKIKVAEGTGGIPYTKSQYDADVDRTTKEIQLKIGKQSAEQIERQQARNEAELKKNQAEIDKANNYVTQQIQRLRDIENKYDVLVNAQASRGIGKKDINEDGSIKIDSNLSKFQEKVKNLEAFLEGMRDEKLDPTAMNNVITMFGELKRFGDNAYLEETAKKGDLSRQSVQSMKDVLTSNIGSFLSTAKLSKGDTSGIQSIAEKLRDSVSEMVSGDEVSAAFTKLKELRAELKNINDEARLDQQSQKEAASQYDDYINKIKALIDAKSQLNQIQTNQLKGEPSELSMDEGLENVKNKAVEAEQALNALFEMWNKGLITDSDFYKAADLFYSEDANQGSMKSRMEQAKAFTKVIEELGESYIKLADAQEKAEHSKTIAGRELAQEDVKRIKNRQEELKTRLGDYNTDEDEYIKQAKHIASLKATEYEEKRNAVVNTKGLGFEQGDNIERTWDVLIQKASQYQQILFKQGSGQTLTVNEELTLQRLAPLYDAAAKQATTASEKYTELQEKVSGAKDVIYNQAIGQYDKIIGGLEAPGENMPQAYNDQVQQLRANLETIRNMDIENPEWFDALNRLKQGINDLKADKFAMPVDEAAKTSLNRRIADWINKNSAGGEYLSQMQDLQAQLSSINSQGDLEQIAQGFENVRASAAEAGKTGLSFGDGLIKRFKSLGQYLLSFASFYRIIGTLKQAVNIVKELDSGLMEVRKVAKETDTTIKQWQKTTFNQADVVGGTASQIEKSTAAWLRLGKSFTESMEAAQASVKLLNVSEFTNIDDATTSLVSMRQAFQDLSYEDFIDKLNGVGDNFSSSTDQLAQGMQNVSAVLKVAGNDIDQSLALLTAANNITQDMSKASMGVRTVALRISGTKAAKEELEELGEDTSDFVVQTESKVDAQVRQLTATASNPNGVSVLDENGRLRDTYDILLDISKVYQEIIDKDNKYGTNSGNALLELLAGKTRSNILASILQAPDILEQAYETSKNSQGVGQRELDVYLDSIEARIQKLQNRLQELAFTAFDSESIKAVVDGFTQLVSLATKLVDTLGVLPTLLGVFGGLMAQKSGYGMLNTSFMVGRNAHGNGKGWGSLISNMFGGSPDTKVIKKEVIKPMSSALQEAMNTMGVDSLDSENMVASIAMSNNKYLKSWISGLDDSEEVKNVLRNALNNEDMSLKDLYNQITLVNTGFEDTQVAVSGASKAISLFGKGVGILKGVGSTLLTMGATMLASFAIQEVVKGIYNWVHANEIAIKKGKEAKDVIDSTYNTYAKSGETIRSLNESLNDLQNEQGKNKKLQSTGDALDNIAEKYTELHKGVNEFTNENVSLSNEDYEQYLQTCSQLAEQFPSLVKGYDDQNNAILSLGDSADTAKGKLTELYAAQQLSANVEIAKQLQPVYDGLIAQEEELTTKNNQLSGMNENLSTVTHNATFEGNVISVDPSDAQSIIDIMSQMYNLGITDQWIDEQSGQMKLYFSGITDLAENEISDLEDIFNNMGKTSEGNAIALNEHAIRANEMMIEDQWSSMTDVIGKYLQTSTHFTQLSEDVQSAILGNIGKLDRSKIKEYGGQVLPFLYSEYIEPLNDLSEQAQDKLANAFTLDPEKMTIGEYSTKVRGILLNAFDGDKSLVDEWWKRLGFENTVNDLLEKQQSVFNSLGGKFSLTPEQRLLIFGIDAGQLDVAKEAALDESVDTFEDFWNQFQKLIDNSKKDIPKDGILSDIFNDEVYKENVEKYKSNLSSVTTALQNLKSEGSINPEDKMGLQELFPDLTDFSYEGISKAGTEELNKWINELTDNWQNFTPEGLEQLDAYVKNLTLSYSDLAVSAGDARTAVFNSLMNTDRYRGMSGYEKIDQAQSETDEKIQALKDEYGEDLNWNIVLALQDYFSGDAQTLIDKYGDYTLEWNIKLSNEEAETQIENLTSERSVLDAQRQYEEAAGKAISKSYYEQDSQISRDLIEQYEKEIENADKEFEKSSKDALATSTHNRVVNTLRQQIYSEMAHIEENDKNAETWEAGIYEDDLSKLKNDAEKAKQIIDDASNYGKEVTADQYQTMIDNAEKQIKDNQWLSDFYNDLAQQKLAEGDYTGFLENTSKANEFSAAIVDLNGNIVEWKNNINSIDNTHLSNVFTQLQNEAEDLEHSLTDKTDGEKAVIYVDLQINAEAQKKNLEAQRQAIIDDFNKKQEENGVEYSFNDPEYQTYLENLRGIDDQLRSLADSQREWANALLNTPIDAINKKIDEYDAKLQEIQDRIKVREAKGGRKTAEDYDSEIELYNQEGITNTVKQGLLNAKAGILEFSGFSDLADEAKKEAQQAGSDAASSFAEGYTSQREKAKLPLTEYDDELTALQQRANAVQRDITAAQEAGADVDASQFDLLISNADQQIAVQESIISYASEQLKGLDPTENIEDYLEFTAAIESAQDAIAQLESGQRDNQKSRIESIYGTPKLERELSNIQDNAHDLQNEITNAEAEYGVASDEQYNQLADLYEQEAGKQSALSRIYDVIANWYDLKGDSTTAQEYRDKANTAADNATQKEADALEERLIPYRNEYNELQHESEQIQRDITKAEQQHQKVSKKTYQDLISNGKAQIRNMKQQQEAIGAVNEDWWDLQNSIDSMNDSIYDWSSTIDSLVFDQASQLASTITTAIQESVSETGLSTETINALLTGFSDLTGKDLDVSEAFYNTADGVKVNTEALRELTEAEFDLQSASIISEIEATQAALNQNPGDSALQQKLERLMQTQAQYFAQYEEMQKALSYNNAIDLAEGTENAGANYDKNYGRVKTYKEAREKGLIGTDDFKAWTSYLDVYGRDTIEAYDAISSKIDRYFTEDASQGLGNFLTDMEKLGYAAQDADGYWTITADDYDAAAKDMQMGSEWFMDTMRKLEDFGMVHTYVSSLTEAQLKTQDAEEQIAEAMQTYGEMVKRGASEEELQKQIDHIHELEQAWSDVNTVRETWGETSEANKKKEFLGIEDQLKAAEKMYAEATTDAGREQAEEYAKSVVEGWEYGLDQEAGDGIFRLDEKSAEDYASRIKKVIGSIENPLSAEEMGISDENVQKYEDSIKTVQERLQNGDLSSLQETLSGLTAEDLNNIDYSDGKYTEGFENAEAAVDSLRDSLGLAKEDTGLLIDVMTALGLVEGTTVESLPSKYEELEQFVASTSKGSGAGYQISADLSDQSLSELNTQMTELNQLEIDAQLDPNSEVYQQLQQLKDDTQLEIDARIQQNITDSGASTTQLKAWAQAGDRESIAKTVGVDVDSSELDQYIQQINSMPDSFDMSVHIDDEQFTQLVNAITDPWSMLITADTSEAEQQTEEFKQKTEKKPIIQTIQQKIQSFGNAVAGLFGGGQKAETTASMDTSGVQKGAKQAEKATKDVSKAKGTATADINIAPAMSKINQLRTALLSLSAIRPMPIVDQSSIGNAISRVQTLINKLNEAASKKNGLALGTAHTLGTAHSLGTTSLSRAYAGGSQDWTVGRDESALVNEIGQESRVRDGVWELIPGGPHVEDLKKDDIIFNAEQTADLIRTGKTARSGKLVAHANGTVPGMSAYVTSGRTNGFKVNKGKSSSKGKSGRGNGGGNGNGGKGGKNKKNNKNKALDNFNKYIEKLFDWIEVRLDRIQRRIDIATKQAEYAAGIPGRIGTISQNKNAYVNTATNETRSLISNNQAGEQRYYKQANKVYAAATSGKTKLLSADKAKKIIQRIKDGTIDITEYNEKERKFIDSYKEWYDKALDCRDAVYELKQQLKELQQQKLDNIIDEFDALTDYAEAVKASSEATIDYYNAAGYAKNTVDRDEIKKQQDRQNEITGLLINEISAYKGELINAEKEFGKNSNEYHEAQTKLEELNKSLIESQKTERELAHAGYDLEKTVRGYFIDRVKALVDKFSSIASLSEKRGTTQRYGINIAQSEDPYFGQIRYNNELILKYYEDIREAQKEIAKEGAQISSERYEELYKTITDGESAITSLLSTNEDLKESIRTLRWKGYNEFQKQLDSINSDLEHIQGFIRDGDIMDNDAQFTDLGFAQIALIGEQMDTAEKKIRNAQGAIAKLDEEYQKNTINLEKYNEELDAQIDIIQDASGAMFDYQQKLADMYIDQITAENDALQDLISARKEALSAKKEYYDYDKTLKNKNKDIAQLQAQINALQGVSNDAAQARRAKLQAELSEKQEDLQDTLHQHSIDLQQEGYDKLSEDMQQALDNAVKLINGDQKVLQDTANHMLDQLKASGIEQKDIVSKIIGDNATKVHNSTQDIIKNLEKDGGIEKLLGSIGTSVGTISDAVKKQELSPKVTNIDTNIPITNDSSNKDISGKLEEIEKAIGTLTQSEQERKKIEQERTQKKQDIQTKLTDLNGQKDTTQTKVDEINKAIEETKSKIEALKKTREAIDNNMATLYETADKYYKAADTLTMQADALNKKADKTKDKKKKAKYKKQANDLLKQADQKRVQAQNYMKQYEKTVAAAPAVMKKNDAEIVNLESKLADLKQELSPLETELAALKEEIAKVKEEGLKLKIEGSLSNGETAAEKDNIGGDVGNPPDLKTAEDIEADQTRVVNPPKLPANNPIKPSANKPSANNNQTTSTDPVVAAIQSGTKRSKKITATEKKNHDDLWIYIVKNMGYAPTNAVYQKLAKALKVSIKNKNKPTSAEKDKILKKLKKYEMPASQIISSKKNSLATDMQLSKFIGFARGVKDIDEDLLAWTNENADKIGPEMIVRPSDGAILTPMKANDSVIPANLADNLFKWGAISPDKFITNPFVGKWSAEGGSSVTNNADYTAAPQTVEMHFDSLFHIEGNVDESVMPRLENLGKSLVNDRDFQKNVIKFVTKDFVRESKKQGIR